MRPFGSPTQLEHRRQQAAILFDKGITPVVIARKLKVDRRSVRRWKANYRKQGAKGLKAKPAPGRPPRINARGKIKLEQALLLGAKHAGFPTDLWTCPRVAALIRKTFRVAYHNHHIPRLLRSLGWSPQKPERLARERDEAAIQRWVKVDWPKIKKKPRH